MIYRTRKSKRIGSLNREELRDFIKKLRKDLRISNVEIIFIEDLDGDYII